MDDFHVRRNLNDKEIHLSRMNFAKRCCADDANLCEIVSVAPEKESQSREFIDKLLADNRFSVRYREQLEKVSATGTVGAYVYLKDAKYLSKADGEITVSGGEIRINYCDADCIIPLTVENNLVIECAFTATNRVKGKEVTTLVVFVSENGKYTAETVLFEDSGRKIDDNIIQLGEVKPFAILTNAEVNNLDDMEGYGLPKIYNTIPLFKAMDLCYNILYGDLDKGQKLVFINELLSCIKTDEKTGMHYLTPQQKELFILLGEKLPTQDSVIKEYNPEIRVEQITKAFELVLSLLSMSFGYGTKKYTFEKSGQIKTATECIIDNQQAMQELNKQRKQASDYITDIVHAAMWFSNMFSGTVYNVNEALSIEFDDSVITDRQSQLEAMRADALSFPEVPELLVWYISEKYNLPIKEAKKLIKKEEEPVEDFAD